MSIIGISGRINSGKDTVGRIIQYLDSPLNINQTSFQDFIAFFGRKRGFESTWQIKKFAGKLKQVATILTGIPIENFEDQEFKKTEMDDVWAVNGMPTTVRQFLQRLGTEAIRDNLHPNAWINALIADYQIGYYPSSSKPGIGYEENWKLPNWIITDLRFPNEFAALKRKDAILIRVVRPGLEHADHISETALDSYIFDEEIVNDGTIDDLINKVKTMMERRNLL